MVSSNRIVVGLTTGLTLVGKCLLVAQQIGLLWRMVGAPQNPRHKNMHSVTHLYMCHRNFMFLWRITSHAPQKRTALYAPQNIVRHGKC